MLALGACSTPEAPPASEPALAQQPQQPAQHLQQPGQPGQQQQDPQHQGQHQEGGFDRLVIPADTPAWDNLSEGFKGNHQFYGERRWDDVIARVIGHQANAMRDLARLDASRGDYAAAAARYAALADRLDGVDIGDEGIAPDLRAMLTSAARRDAALCEALAAGEAPPIPEDWPVSALRARYLGAGDDAAALAAVAADAATLAAQPPWGELDPAAFEDFDARHELRLVMYRYALDTTDPLRLDYRWDYWRPEEASLQVKAVAGAAALKSGSLVERPANLAAGLRVKDLPPDFTPEGLGGLPTGDSYIDVGGEPGPLAIGRLAKLGLDDAEHYAWLETLADKLDAALAADPKKVPPLIGVAAIWLDEREHGSRFYNIKQLRNDGARQLARAGEYALALEVLRGHYPLHAQDWACPNREGIALGLEGRLMALAGEDGAEAKLEEAVAAGDRWLADIAGAKRAPSGGR